MLIPFVLYTIIVGHKKLLYLLSIDGKKNRDGFVCIPSTARELVDMLSNQLIYYHQRTHVVYRENRRSMMNYRHKTPSGQRVKI